MAKLVLPATELTNVSVDRVALVKRGANRIPFRIIKSEDGETMDLYRTVRDVFKKADPKPAVVAAFVNGNFAAVAGSLKKCEINFTGDITKSDDDVVILGKADANAVLVKLDDDTLLAVSHLSKSFPEGVPEFNGYEPGSVPSIGLAMDAMVHAVKSEMAKDAPDQKALAAFIKQAATEFGEFAFTMAENLPASVLKFDTLLKGTTQTASMMSGTEDDMDGKDCADGSKKKKAPAFVQKGQTVTPAATQNGVDENKDSIEANQTGGGDLLKGEVIQDKPAIDSKTSEEFKHGAVSNDIEGDPAEGNPKGKTGTKVQDAEGATSNDIEGSPKAGSTTSDTAMPGGIKKEEMEALMKGLFGAFSEEVNGALLGIQKQVNDLRKDSAETKELARKAEETVNGYVGAEPASDRTGTMRKSESKPDLRPIDTAFMKIA